LHTHVDSAVAQEHETWKQGVFSWLAE